MAKEHIVSHMDFGFPELVQAFEELKDVSFSAAGENQWQPVVLQVVAERSPVTPLLRFVSA